MDRPSTLLLAAADAGTSAANALAIKGPANPFSSLITSCDGPELPCAFAAQAAESRR